MRLSWVLTNSQKCYSALLLWSLPIAIGNKIRSSEQAPVALQLVDGVLLFWLGFYPLHYSLAQELLVVLLKPVRCGPFSLSVISAPGRPCIPVRRGYAEGCARGCSGPTRRSSPARRYLGMRWGQGAGVMSFGLGDVGDLFVRALCHTAPACCPRR